MIFGDCKDSLHNTHWTMFDLAGPVCTDTLCTPPLQECNELNSSRAMLDHQSEREVELWNRKESYRDTLVSSFWSTGRTHRVRSSGVSCGE